MTTTESFEEFLKLKSSTAECDEGPEVVLRQSSLTVRYDTETETGRAWTMLRFCGVVALRVTPEPAVSAMVAQAYSRVGTITDSVWLQGIRGMDGTERLPDDLKHFVVFFDHYGSVEALARTCEVEE